MRPPRLYVLRRDDAPEPRATADACEHTEEGAHHSWHEEQYIYFGQTIGSREFLGASYFSRFGGTYAVALGRRDTRRAGQTTRSSIT